MTAVKKAHQSRSKRDLRATRRTKSATKRHKRTQFQRPTEGPPSGPGDKNG